MSLLQTSRQGSVLLLHVSNPPVNGLSFALRTALMHALDGAEAAPDVLAVVIHGGAKAFSGGADIREFGQPQALAQPNLPSLCARLDEMSKPVVAAIEGLALGGGLELALACHYRVVQAKAQIGLPEVNLGLLPGAGGTQRFPRAVGLATALKLIPQGRLVRAQELAALPAQRLFDDVVAEAGDGAVLAAAVALAQRIQALRPLPRLRDQTVAPDAEAEAQALAASEGLPYPAPLACVQAVRGAASLPFEDGIRAERAGFEGLLHSPESAALRHVFFAERAAGKVPGVEADTPRARIQSVGVVGAGTMGQGIALACAQAGLPVQLVEPDAAARARALSQLDRHWVAQVEKGRLSADKAQTARQLMTVTERLGDLAQADLLIEAVYEDMALKQAVFREMDAIAKPEALLASNTSTLDMDALAQVTQRPDQVLGLHFFSPAAVMKLLEVVRGAATSPTALASALAFGKQIGKTCVVAGNADGFIGNRMVDRYLEQALFLLDEGCTPQQVDQAIEAWGLAMGPFRMIDMAGNDVSWRVRQQRAKDGKLRRAQPLADRLCELGRFGQKAGGGWYDYDGREARPSKAVAALIAAHREQMGRPARTVGAEEIVDRLLLALGIEGERLLAEGVALRASDIDLVYVLGYGFPRWKGGPMFELARRGEGAVAALRGAFAAVAHDDAAFWAPVH
ncbi:3-hydroxyacyl-CoA dehydrogenase NAD-binding domain-containing protein [Inhella gelatinilytica]|uniref:Enoyl-CoA hydratase/isomerase family protein n=1 Tax=Inhella gelatinilytica TaxID=2795030 RepID=A0A931NDJ7_9BURK|nr:3-hydroxyacyl-CoA dehydrogenase NAD-binding domain-containing protein [Inhella gelatinilytica]MBH9553157.1 enoyl-CoA hydratase/isomerase family protein [Inhella gelatinilytica]